LTPCKKLNYYESAFKNERDGSESPRTKYKKFIDNWLEWVHGGSKRDKDGNPIIEKKAKEAKIA
jgi:hypothetical protein